MKPDPPPPATPPDTRPAIAVISNSHTPYRLHLHLRIANEIPQVQLFSLYTHETSNSSWSFDVPETIGPILFGRQESAAKQDRLGRQFTEWRRGGRMIRWLRDHQVRFVLVMGYNDVARLRVMRWCRQQGVPCYLFGDSNIHGDHATGLKAVVKRLYVRNLLRWCNGVFVCGRLGKAYFARYGVPPSRLFLYPYEPNYDLIARLSPDTIAATARHFHLPLNRKRIVYSGRLIDLKRVDLLIDAFLAIAEQRAEWDLLIVGDGVLRSSLQDRVPSRLFDRVQWAGFVDDQATVSALYRASDVLVLPSDYEPWALVINEAVAAGLAVVASRIVGAAAELVTDHLNGRLFEPGNLSQLTECLLDVTNIDTLAQMKRAAPAQLADWRRRGDPVAGLQAALRVEGLLPANGV